MASLKNKILDPVTQGLSDRQYEVIEGRFGLGKQKEPKTLEAIGKKYSVTRERVRQIEASALGILKGSLSRNGSADQFFKEGKQHLKDAGGVLSKPELVKKLGKTYRDCEENHVELLLAASGAFLSRPEDDDFVSLYHVDKESFDKAKGFVSDWAKELRSKKEAVLSGKSYDDEFKKFLNTKRTAESHGKTYMEVSKRVKKNVYGDVGLAEWPEINPKAIRDRIYLALKKHGEPAHFTDIASLINKAGISGKRTALASTVHNELIKDNRFVLVGRGMYALREHGFEPGTAKEVIQRVLKNKGPMHFGDVVLAVQKERFLKENTIAVNLQNRDLFVKRPDGKFHVREV